MAQSARCVLVICNDADYFIRHRQAVVAHLVSIGVEVTVMTGGEPIAADRVRGWSYIHVPIERFAFHPSRDGALLMRTFNAVRRLKPDAVHLITMKPMVFGGLATVAARLFCGRPRRILITVPGLGRMMSGAPADGGSATTVARYLSEQVARFLAARAGVHFTFETRHDRDVWVERRLTSVAASTVIDGAGVDPARFFPAKAERSAARAKVLFASRLLRSKGLDSFIEVARMLAGRTDLEFLVAGIFSSRDPDGVSPAELERETSIRFLGAVDDMPTLLRECDIVCLPTRYGEGIPRILIEAAATGIASIASDIPGCREVVVDGVTGRLVSGDRGGMAAAMRDALLGYLAQPQLIRQHGREAYRLFRSRDFDEKVVAARFREMLGF